MKGGSMAKLFTTGDVAKRLGVSANTVRTWTDEGHISYIALPSGHRRYEQEEVTRFLDSLRVPKGHAAVDKKRDADVQREQE
jgi:putative resolvase